MQLLVEGKRANTIDCHVMNFLLKSPHTAAFPKVPWSITVTQWSWTIYFFELKCHSTVAEYVLWMILQVIYFHLHGNMNCVLSSLCHTAKCFDVWLCFSTSLVIQTLCWHLSMCPVTIGSCWLSTPVWETFCMSIHWGRSRYASKPSWMRGTSSLRDAQMKFRRRHGQWHFGHTPDSKMATVVGCWWWK